MADPVRLRREPPPFRTGHVVSVEDRSPHLRRVTIAGEELVGLPEPGLAASIRWLPARDGRIALPTWNGNEFLDADGRRPPIRTLTPLAVDAAAGRLAVEVVLHDTGPLSDWARAVVAGTPVALSGPGRGYEIDPSARRYLLAGDESALPAIGQLLEHLPEGVRVDAEVEVARPDARLDLPAHPGATVRWHDLPPGHAPGDALVAAVARLDLDDGARVWVAGEAASVQRIRTLLFGERGLPRGAATIRGYWKRGRAGE